MTLFFLTSIVKRDTSRITIPPFTACRRAARQLPRHWCPDILECAAIPSFGILIHSSKFLSRSSPSKAVRTHRSDKTLIIILTHWLRDHPVNVFCNSCDEQTTLDTLTYPGSRAPLSCDRPGEHNKDPGRTSSLPLGHYTWLLG